MNNLKNNNIAELPDNFIIENGYLYKKTSENSKIEIGQDIRIIARIKDENDENQGALIKFFDRDGVEQELSILYNELSNSDNLAKRLLDKGYIGFYKSNHKSLFSEFIQKSNPRDTNLSFNKIGWNKNKDYFILPDETIPKNNSFIFTGNRDNFKNIRQKGSLKEWQDNIAKLCNENDILLFALSVAFTSPIIRLLQEEIVGFHFIGNSSNGKTTALKIAGSVCGGNDKDLLGYLETYRATANSLESIAQSHNDFLLCLDELALIDSKEASNLFYSISGGKGKSRLNSNSILKKNFEWSFLFLSSGEISLEQKLNENFNKIPLQAGQNVRFINIFADGKSEMGIFQNIHNCKTPKEFADLLNDNSKKYYGTAIREFIKLFIENKGKNLEFIKLARKEFSNLVANKINNLSSQALRVLSKFSLIAGVGELAVYFNILPYKKGVMFQATLCSFNLWLEWQENTNNNQEEINIIERIKVFFEKRGDTNSFLPLESTNNHKQYNDIIGYKDTNYFYFKTSIFKDKICNEISKYNQTMVIKALSKHQFLKKDKEGKSSISKLIKEKQARVYAISKNILNWGDKND